MPEPNFKLFDPSDHDSQTQAAIALLPQPVEIKRLPGKEGWCVRVNVPGDLPKAAIAKTLLAAARRMKMILEGPG